MMMIDIAGPGRSPYYVDADKIETVEMGHHAASYRSLITLVGGKRIECEGLWPREIVKLIEEQRAFERLRSGGSAEEPGRETK